MSIDRFHEPPYVQLDYHKGRKYHWLRHDTEVAFRHTYMCISSVLQLVDEVTSRPIIIPKYRFMQIKIQLNYYALNRALSLSPSSVIYSLYRRSHSITMPK